MVFDHALKGFFGLGIVSSLYMNSMIRRQLMVYEALIFTSVGISALTCGVNLGIQNWLIQWPLLEGKMLMLCCCWQPRWITAKLSASVAVDSGLIPVGSNQ